MQNCAKPSNRQATLDCCYYCRYRGFGQYCYSSSSYYYCCCCCCYCCYLYCYYSAQGTHVPQGYWNMLIDDAKSVARDQLNVCQTTRLEQNAMGP